jgi:hypothetical protein
MGGIDGVVNDNDDLSSAARSASTNHLGPVNKWTDLVFQVLLMSRELLRVRIVAAFALQSTLNSAL